MIIQSDQVLRKLWLALNPDQFPIFKQKRGHEVQHALAQNQSSAPMKLTSKEYDLLEFASASTLGVIRTTNTEADNVAYSLYQKGFLLKFKKSGPFVDGCEYWSVTKKAHEYINNLQ